MKYDERKALMDSLDFDLLRGGPTAADQIKANGYRWGYLIPLLADIAESLSGMSYAYREMLKIQQVKSGLAGSEKSRYGGAAPAGKADGK